MKTIGYTEQGNQIVVLERDEALTFQALREVVDGRGLDWHRHLADRPNDTIDHDFTNTISAIRRWIESKSAVIEMQNRLDEIKEILDG